MWKKILCFILSLTMVFSITGCNREEKKKGEYQIYYLNMDMSKIVAEDYDSTGAEDEKLVEELLAKLQSAPESSKLRQTIPSDVKINSFKKNGAYLYIDFSEEYKALKPEEEILIRAAIVKTLVQTSPSTLVAFTINSDPLLAHDGTLVGSMHEDSFVENPGKQINSSVETTLNLYFANKDGTKLVKETRTVHYSTNISMEKLIMEQLIEGSKKSSTMSTVPSGTKLISVSVVDGVCYVNLSDSFRNQNAEVNEEIVLYSIVNSLTELQGVSQVQISINGSTDGKLRYSYDLSKLYERNLDYLKED
ncbi:MAG: GerMN domain-containing protein [Agathobacter sp.]|nr:GerMN domain-containing protein [Agathobacter sp.]